MTIVIASIFGFVLAILWEIFCVKIVKKTSLIVLGYRLHHSIYGLLFVIFGLWLQNIVLLGLGIGIIVQHTVSDGFRFVSKE